MYENYGKLPKKWDECVCVLQPAREDEKNTLYNVFKME